MSQLTELGKYVRVDEPSNLTLPYLSVPYLILPLVQVFTWCIRVHQGLTLAYPK